MGQLQNLVLCDLVMIKWSCCTHDEYQIPAEFVAYRSNHKSYIFIAGSNMLKGLAITAS